MENAYDHQQMMHMMPPETFSGSNFVCPTSSQWSNGYMPSNTDLYGTSLVRVWCFLIWNKSFRLYYSYNGQINDFITREVFLISVSWFCNLFLQVSRSPSDSFNLPSPVDYNSYSPPQSHSSSSSCYSSPTRMDLSSSFSPENYHYQHCNLQHCFCLSHWSNAQEGMATSEYAPYGSSDCLFSYSDDSYFRRDTSNSEMCYL